MTQKALPTWILIRSCRFLAQFSGHAVVPSLYRDMAQPATFNSMIDVAYIFTFVVTMLFAALGYLMFGNGVSSEITRDLAKTPGYPVALNKLAVWMVAVSRCRARSPRRYLRFAECRLHDGQPLADS